VILRIPLELRGGLNAREHHMARAERVDKEREVVAWCFKTRDARAQLAIARDLNKEGRWVVTLTRVAPCKPDDDNNVGRLKSVRDEVAKVLGIDDKHRDILRFEYAQARGRPREHAVDVEILPFAQWRQRELDRLLREGLS
jgi:hypothetical protein